MKISPLDPQGLPEFRLEAYMERWEFRAAFHLSAADAESVSIGELLELTQTTRVNDLLDVRLEYTPTWGSDRLRAAIASTYKTCTLEDVLCFAGAQEALYWLLMDDLGAGDHVICIVPNYQSLEDVPRLVGAEVSGIPVRPVGSSWYLDLDELRSMLRGNTKLVVLNFPHNPTGFVMEEGPFTELAELCDRCGIRLVVDEAYRGIESSSVKTLIQAADVSPSAVSVNVLSKAYGLPGLRLGWVASRDSALLKRLEKRKHWTSICNASPSEFLGIMAIRHRNALLQRARCIVSQHVSLCERFFSQWGEQFEWSAPDGGCVAFPRYGGREGADALCADLLQGAGVLLLPPRIFESSLWPGHTDRFRIGLGRRNFPEGLEAMRRFLDGRR